MSVVDLAFLGFIIGLTGAIAPGPTLIATISASIKTGWTGGPKITGGHIIAEFLIVALIAIGIPFIPADITHIVAIPGGIALIAFGILTIRSVKGATLQVQETERGNHTPVIAGLVTSLSNPYFWIWWISVGSALLISSFAEGFFGVAAFLLGHWSADLGWFTFVSTGIHSSRHMLTDQAYRYILGVCGLFLCLFGGYFIFIGQ